MSEHLQEIEATQKRQSLEAIIADANRLNRESEELQLGVCRSVLAIAEIERECGEMLITAKASMPHGRWLMWVDENLSFKRATALRRMNFANYSRGSNLRELIGDSASMRQVYLKSGVVPALPRPEGQSRSDAGEKSFVSYIRKADHWFDEYFKERTVEELPLNELEAIASGLEKSAKRYEEVTEQIKKVREAA